MLLSSGLDARWTALDLGRELNRNGEMTALFIAWYIYGSYNITTQPYNVIGDSVVGWLDHINYTCMILLN